LFGPVSASAKSSRSAVVIQIDADTAIAVIEFCSMAMPTVVVQLPRHLGIAGDNVAGSGAVPPINIFVAPPLTSTPSLPLPKVAFRRH